MRTMGGGVGVAACVLTCLRHSTIHHATSLVRPRTGPIRVYGHRKENSGSVQGGGNRTALETASATMEGVTNVGALQRKEKRTQEHQALCSTPNISTIFSCCRCRTPELGSKWAPPAALSENAGLNKLQLSTKRDRRVPLSAGAQDKSKNLNPSPRLPKMLLLGKNSTDERAVRFFSPSRDSREMV